MEAYVLNEPWVDGQEEDGAGLLTAFEAQHVAFTGRGCSTVVADGLRESD